MEKTGSVKRSGEVSAVVRVENGDALVEGEKPGWRRYRGLMLALISAFFLSLVFITAKVLKDKYHPYSIAQWKFAGYLVPSIPISLYFHFKKKTNIFEQVWPVTGDREKRLRFILINVRGILVFTNTVLRFWALQYIQVGDVSAIASSVPVFVMIMAHFLLGEICGIVPIVVTVITCAGILVIAHPPLIFGGADTYLDGIAIGTALTFISVLCGATSAIIGRRTRKVHCCATMLSFGVWGILGAMIVAGINGQLEFPVTTKEYLLAYGALPVCAFLTRVATTLAQKFDAVGTVTLVDKAMDVFFAFMWQIFLFDIIPDVYSSCGAAIIMFGVFISGVRKWLSTLPKDSSIRRCAWFLLR